MNGLNKAEVHGASIQEARLITSWQPVGMSWKKLLSLGMIRKEAPGEIGKTAPLTAVGSLSSQEDPKIYFSKSF